MNFTLNEIATITSGKIIHDSTKAIEHIFIDSRNAFKPSKSLFIAIKGEHHDGHHFIDKLSKLNCLTFLVSNEHFNFNDYPNCSFILVENTLDALQKIAAFHRKKFTLPVVAIAGSYGKTIVKEWMYELLKDNYNIIRSPKSYNSQIGVALSILQLSEEHNLAIFEAGISMPNEMEKLKEMILPTHGIFTSFGEAHQQNFNSPEEKLSEKLKLFEGIDFIYNQDITPLSTIKKSTYSYGKNASFLKLIEVQKLDSFSVCKIEFKGIRDELEIPYTDDASIQNCLTSVTASLMFGLELEELKEKVFNLHPIALRLEITNGINNCSLLHDYYTSDIESLQIALNKLSEQKLKNKTLIISDFADNTTNQYIEQIAALLQNHNINKLITVGKSMVKLTQFFDGEVYSYDDTEGLLDCMEILEFKNEAILIKGSRNFKFEKIGNYLSEKSHITYLEINLKQVERNITYFKTLLQQNTKLLLMIKASGYGSGAIEIAKKAESIGVNNFGVAYADEGVELRKAGIEGRIIVMNPEPQAFNDILIYNLEPSVYSFKLLDDWTRFLILNKRQSYPIHIKIDSGMNRLGFAQSQINQLTQYFLSQPEIKITSVFSHLATADGASQDDFTNSQFLLFEEICNKISKVLPYEFDRHILNTSGILRFPEKQFEMVRLGLGIYGVSPIDNENNISPIAKLYSKISQIKKVKKGESVGYGRSFISQNDITIAIIPLGYADGYSRILSNGIGKVNINGKLCKTVGNICMDMFMVDVSDINCHEGDVVEIFGNNPTIEELAKLQNTIPYEILSRLSHRIYRKFIEE